MSGDVHDITATDRFVRDALQEWADGSRTQEAAVQLLIRGFNGRFARAGHPWIQRTGMRSWGLDCAAITTQTIGALSSGEQRYLRIAASIGGGEPVNLNENLSLDRGLLDLVLAAIAHSAGSHEDTVISYDTRGGAARFDHPDTLYPWPDDKQSP